MVSGYERAYRDIIPAARAALINKLKNKYNLKEEYISKYTEITQAAISKYVNGKYSERIKEIEAKLDQKITEMYAEKIANGDKTAVNSYLCTICNTMNNFDCRFSSIKKTSV